MSIRTIERLEHPQFMAFLEAGMRPACVQHLGTTDEATRAVNDLVAAGDIVLVKGSRRMQLERVVEELVRVHGGEDD